MDAEAVEFIDAWRTQGHATCPPPEKSFAASRCPLMDSDAVSGAPALLGLPLVAAGACDAAQPPVAALAAVEPVAPSRLLAQGRAR